MGNHARVEGLVGPLSIAAGATPIAGTVPMEPAMGVVEVVRHLGVVRHNRRAIVAAAEGFDVFVAVDSPDFHLPVARELRRRGLRTVGYVSPQLWAWRPGRAPTIAAAYDRLLCLFAFEPALYAGTSLDVRWVGHPAVDRVEPSRREPGVVAVFPGSRPAEVARHLAPFVEAARGAEELLIAGASGVERRPVEGARWVDADEALARAERAITKSGTVTLELAVARIPFVVAHRVHPLTWWIGRALVRGVRHLALPNVLAGAEVVPEFRQHFTVQQLQSALKVVSECPLPDLGPQGVAERAAAAVLG